MKNKDGVFVERIKFLQKSMEERLEVVKQSLEELRKGNPNGNDSGNR